MAQVSYPVLGSAMGEAQWRVMARAWGAGIVDSGASPYRIVSVNDTNNTITIGRDTGTGTAEAMVNGFVHRIDTDVALTVPTAAGTYELGIVYDPAGHGTAAGPLTLQCWVAPGDFTNGKQRLPLYRVTRAAAQALSVAPRTSLRVFAHPSIMVASSDDLPARPQDYPWGTEVLCYFDGRRFRANVTEWTEIPTTDPRIDQASGAVVPGVLVLRGSDGNFLVPAPTHGSHPARLIDLENFRPSWNEISGKPSTYPPSGHNHSAGNITSGELDPGRVRGSDRAWTRTSGTSASWATVTVDSNGEFFRYSSAAKYKTNIRPLAPTPADRERIARDGLGIESIIFDRVDNGLTGYIGVLSDLYADTFPNLVQFGEDGEVEGWHYELWTVIQQIVLQYLDERVTKLEARAVAAEKRADGLEDRVAKLEAAVAKLTA